MSNRGKKVLALAVAAYFLIGWVVASVALHMSERDFFDPPMFLMGVYFALLWPIVLGFLISGRFRK